VPFSTYATFSFGSSQTGLSDLRVQPRTSANASTGSAITTGFTEIGLGVYDWAGSVPDDAVSLKGYSAANPTTVFSVRSAVTNSAVKTSADAALRPTTSGRTLDVSATGESGLDFDNVKQATGATTLTNITVPVVGAVSNIAAQTGDAYARIGANGAGLTAITPLTAQQVRDAMKLAPSVGAAAVDSIDDKIGEIPTTGPAGPGADQVTLNWTNSTTGLPVENGQVWVTTDAAGSNVYAGTLTTDSDGDALFLLDAGNNYYFWAQKSGVNPIRGVLFVAVAD
jgi:hypothetical protein